MPCLGQDVVDSLEFGVNACSIYAIRRSLLLRHTGVQEEKKSLTRNSRITPRNAVCILACSSHSGYGSSRKGQSLVSAVISFTQHFATVAQCTDIAAGKILITLIARTAERLGFDVVMRKITKLCIDVKKKALVKVK